MELKHLFSVTALSLCGLVGLSAEDIAVKEGFAMLEEEVASSESVEKPSRPAATPVATAAEEKPAAKRAKPHFAGAKRPLDVKKVPNPNKPKRVKNQWFSSKTQPKIVRKEDAYEEVTHLPDDHPHFVKTQYLVADAASSMECPEMRHSHSQAGGYPKTGVEAPNGHVFITGDWLFFRVREEGTEFVTNHEIEFDYTSGWRLGLGVHLPYTDGWDIYANYTYFTSHASRDVEGAFYPLFLYQGAGSPVATVTSAEGHWGINFQTMDLQFGRAFYLAKSLSVHPFAGMKGAWIDQHAHFDYEGGDIPAAETFFVHFTNDFKGAGPLFGIDSRWHWGAGFNLLGKVSSALVIGHFDSEQEQEQLSSEVVDYSNGFNLVSPMVQMLIALGWDRNFNHERSHLGLSLGFESQYWWSQNQIQQFSGAAVPSYQRQNGALALYGLTLQARFDF